MDRLERGTLVKWNEAGGYGFIKPDRAAVPDLFFHIRDCRDSRPPIGSSLEYIPLQQRDGRWRARAVRVVTRRNAEAPRVGTQRRLAPLPTWVATLLLAGFAVIWTWATLHKLVPTAAQWYLLVINVATISAYWRDKRSAARLGQRTPELLLHGLEITGGWPGAWLAQRLFRHKSSKQRYLWTFLLMITINLFAFGIWLDAQLRINATTLPPTFPLL